MSFTVLIMMHNWNVYSSPKTTTHRPKTENDKDDSFLIYFRFNRNLCAHCLLLSFMMYFYCKKKKTWVFFNIRLQWWVALSINLIKSFSNIISVILEFIDCKQWPNKENVIDLDEKTSLIKTPAGRNANLASMLIYYTCVSYDSQ